MDDGPRKYKQRLYGTPAYRRYKKENSAGGKEGKAGDCEEGVESVPEIQRGRKEESSEPRPGRVRAVVSVDRIDEMIGGKVAGSDIGEKETVGEETPEGTNGNLSKNPHREEKRLEALGAAAVEVGRRRRGSSGFKSLENSKSLDDFIDGGIGDEKGGNPVREEGEKGKDEGTLVNIAVKAPQNVPTSRGRKGKKAKVEKLCDKVLWDRTRNFCHFYRWTKIVGYVADALGKGLYRKEGGGVLQALGTLADMENERMVTKFGKVQTSSVVEAAEFKSERKKRSSPASPVRLTKVGDTAKDTRFLHFLSKVCRLGKSSASSFIKEEQKNLAKRTRRNKAELLDGATYTHSTDDASTTIKTTSTQKTHSIVETTVLTKVACIAAIVPPLPVSVELDYAVYKCKENFKRLAGMAKVSLQDAILLHYLYAHRAAHPSDAFVDLVVKNDWTSPAEALVFKTNYKKHGTNFGNYNMKKTDEELKIYLRHFLKTMSCSQWTAAERLGFAQAFATHGKDWDAIAKLIPTKTRSAIRLYYINYYQRLLLDENSMESASWQGNSDRKEDGEPG